MTNTYKVTIEANVQAESEQAAKTCCVDLLNSPQAINPQTGATASLNNARIAGINNIECDCLFEDKNTEQTNNIKKEQDRLANEELKKIEKDSDKQFGKELEVPDEVVVKNPETGTNQLVSNPNKEQQQKQEQEQQPAKRGRQAKKEE